jgi:TonB family protein
MLMATPVKYRNGLMGTVLFHGTLLIMLLYLAFSTPLPLPAEQGILVDFGNSDRGFGDYEPRMSDPAPVQSQPVQPTSTVRQQEQILTQDVEETVALPSRPVTKPAQTQETQRVTPNETPRETAPTIVEQPKPVERTVDSRAMFPGRGNPASTATSQGEAGGQGNQGVPTGAPDVHVYGEGGDAAGNKWGLSGRNLVGRLPLPTYNLNEDGVVVVAITVDKDGNVTKATSGVKGSTTLNKTLLDAAERAARQAKFTRNPNAIEQTGTITYIFKLQGN